MKLLPQSLFGRTVLLFSIMMLLNYLTSIIVYFVFFTRPFAEITAYNFSQKVEMIQHALLAMPEDKKIRYLNKLQLDGHISLHRKSSFGPGYNAENIYQRIVQSEIIQHLAPTIKDIKFQMKDDPQIIWASLKIQNKQYWLGVPSPKLKGAFPWNLLSQLAVVITLTLIAALLIARKIKNPLARLEQAAIKLGKGESPEPLPEKGLIELETMSKTFNNMAADIEKLAEDRNLLLAGVSHDLRTPLARMRIATEMLDPDIDPQLTEGMVADIEDMDNIIGQFLTFVREGTDEPDSRSNINQLIEHLHERYTRANKVIRLNLGEIPALEFKPVAMQRLLMNLIDNAWYYGNRQVEVATYVNQNHLIIDVMDRGPGIAENETEMLTKPFTRKDTARTNSDGAGLGLAIVKRIASWHRGHVSFHKREGGGLIARVALPYDNPGN